LALKSPLCFFRLFAICSPSPKAVLGAGLSLSHLSSFRGPPQFIGFSNFERKNNSTRERFSLSPPPTAGVIGKPRSGRISRPCPVAWSSRPPAPNNLIIALNIRDALDCATWERIEKGLPCRHGRPHFLDGHRRPRLHRVTILSLTISLFKYPEECERLALARLYATVPKPCLATRDRSLRELPCGCFSPRSHWLMRPVVTLR